MKRKTIVLLVTMGTLLHLFETYCHAHPYLPLTKGSSAILDYSFRIDTTRKEFKQADTNGTMQIQAMDWSEHSGKTYLRYITSYQNIPFMTQSVELYRREAEGNVYVANEQGGKLVETMELPAKVDLGSEWAYDDGEKSTRKVTATTEVKLPSGEILKDCIEVTRTTHKKSLSDVVNKNYYCRDFGEVRSLFVQPSPVGEYRTETIRKKK